MDKSIRIAKYHWDDGIIKREEFLTEDNLLIVKDYNSVGTLWQETTLDEDNEKHGLHRLYYPTGKIKLEEEFDHGKPISQKTFSENGQQLTQDDYEEGEIKRRIILMIGIIEF